MTQTLASAVGLNSANRSSDVLAVQTLLNGVSASYGGPTTPLDMDGIFGDNTAQAISAFQMKQFGWADCVVSPGQATLQRLNALSRHADANVALTVKNIINCVGYLGQIPGVYTSFGAQCVLLNDLSARLKPAVLSASATTTDNQMASVRSALPIFGEVIPWPFPIPGGAAAPAGAGPQGLILLALILLAYIIVNRPVAIPQTDADKALQRELTELEKLTIMLSVAQATKVQQKVKAEVKSIEDCLSRRLDRVFDCKDLIAIFKKVSADVLRKLQTYITSTTTFPGLLKALNDALNNYNELLKPLRDCLKCDELDKQGTFFPRIRSGVAMRGFAATARGSAKTGQLSCGLMQDCPSCPQGYLASGLLQSGLVHRPP